MRADAFRLMALLLLVLATTLVASQPGLAEGERQTALIHKSSVDVHSGPDSDTKVVATLKRKTPIDIVGAEDIWYHIEWTDLSGYVRIDGVRMKSAKTSPSRIPSVFAGKAGTGLEVEIGGVRTLDENDLKAAQFDATQFAKLESYRTTPQLAATAAQSNGWAETEVAYAAEARRGAEGGASQAEKRSALDTARGVYSRIRGKVDQVLGGNGLGDSALDIADAAVGKSEEEILAEELALGPQLAGRILGAAPLWRDDAAQRRVNNVGRWMASQTTRPELPWTFGIIDAPEVNAFATPGGYVLMTRGMYELLASDAEIAAVLGHEITHVVQRDHYNVIRKQQITAAGQDAVADQVKVGGGMAEQMAQDYVRRHGAAVMLTKLDRDAEYHADEAAEIYLARSGFNPLTLYAVLQKMTALGTASPSLAQLYKTHPPLDDRLDRIDRRSFAGLERYMQR